MPACIRYCTEEFRPLSFQKDSSGWIQTSAIQISTGDKVPIPTTLIQVATNLYNFNLFIHVILWREVVQKHSLNQSQPPWNMSIKYKTTHQTMAFTDKQESMSRWRLLIKQGRSLASKNPCKDGNLWSIKTDLDCVGSNMQQSLHWPCVSWLSVVNRITVIVISWYFFLFHGMEPFNPWQHAGHWIVQKASSEYDTFLVCLAC